MRIFLGTLLIAANFGLATSLTAQESVRPPSVTVAVVERAEMMDQVPISGTVVARDEVLIYPQVSGFTIDAMYVDIGDLVVKGDVLAELNQSTLQAHLAQADAEYARATAGISQAESQIRSAEASLTQAQSVLDRAERLLTSGAGTQASLDQAIATQQTAAATLASVTDGLAVAIAQRQQAQAQLDIAQLDLDHATIIAPVDGLISARNGRLGAIATSSGEPIFRLISDGAVELEAEVVETAMSDLAIGNEVLLDVAGLGPMPGEVRRISPIVDPVTRLGLVRITTAPDGALRTGLFASGWIIITRREALSVPATAVLTDASGSYVLRVVDNVIERSPITAGLIWRDKREVIAGVDLGDIVVAKAAAFFADGDLVTPVPAVELTAQEASQ